MKDLFAPNRVAVLTALLGAVAAAIATLLGAVDTTEKAIVVAVALVAVAAVIIVYLLGAQRWEALTFRAATGTPEPAATTVVVAQGAPAPDPAASAGALPVTGPRPPVDVADRAAARAAERSAWDGVDDHELVDPTDLADEARQPVTNAAAMPPRGEHAGLDDGDAPTDPDPQAVTP